SETYKQVSDCLSSGGSVNRSLSDLRCVIDGLFCICFSSFELVCYWRIGRDPGYFAPAILRHGESCRRELRSNMLSSANQRWLQFRLCLEIRVCL
ncbi:hypothetical protein, partial [Shewanella algae]